MDHIWHYDSPLGGITLAGNGDALIGLWFDGQKHYGSTLGAQSEEKWLPVFGQALNWLDTYFGGKVPGFTPKLELRTTPFRRDVYNILLTIPYSNTLSYKDIAQRIAINRSSVGIAKQHSCNSKGALCTRLELQPRESTQLPNGSMSARAVGSAVGHNPISLIIPCHRVLDAEGSLRGYAAGLERKQYLLTLEATRQR